MTQKIDPFIKGYWGWATGEGGWGEGMNYNLIIQAFLQNKRINSVISSASLLPVSPADGDVYFAVADKTIYLRAEGSWYTFQPTLGMEFILKTTEEVVKFNGTNLVTATKEISEINGLTAALATKVATSSVGAASGVAPLGVDGKVPAGYLPASGSYLGTWNATTNTPTITSSVGSNGEFYIVSVAGNVSINGINTWSAGDQIRFNGSVWQRIPNTSSVASVNGYTGTVVLTNTDVGAAATSHTHTDATTSTSGFLSSTDKTKLDGVAVGATANSSDATLLARANHTGTQAQSTIVNLVSDLSAKQDTLVNTVNIKSINGTSLLGSGNINVSTGGSTTFIGLTDVPASYTSNAFKVVRVNSGETSLEFIALGTAAFNNTGDFATSSHTHANATTSLAGFLSSADKIKLDGIASGATVNSSDATLLARANHTGTQLSSTISDFNTAADARVAAGITGKAPLASPTFSGTVVLPSTTSIGTVTSTQIGYLVNTTSDIQTQINAKQAVLGFTPYNATNPAGYTSNVGTVTSFTFTNGSGFTGTVNTSTTTPTLSLVLQNASTSQSGQLTSTDWNTFNNKQTALGYTPVNKAGDTMTGQLNLGTGSGQQQLHINGADSGTSNGSSIFFKNSGTVNNAIGNLSAIIGGAYDTTLLFYSNSDISFYSGGSTKALLKAGGNFLIGTTTDNGQKLQVSGAVSAASFTGDGSGLTSLSASNINSGILPDSRLPTVMTPKTFGNGSGQQVVYIDSGSSGSNSGGNITFKGSGVSHSAIGTYSSIIGGAYNQDLVLYAGSSGIQFMPNGVPSVTISSGGILSATNASGLSQLNASNLSSGTVSNSRLTVSTTSVAGIVQLGDGTTAPSTTKAATEQWVYGINQSLSTLGGYTIYNDKPEQLFQSLGTVSGSVSVSSGSGIHVLATVNGNTTWTFPTPASNKAMALTLELTNGGAYTMTWPSGTRWAGGVAPTLTASGTDILVFTKAGTNGWRGYLSSKDNK